MNSVHDAYQPPATQPMLSKFWFRFIVLTVLLAGAVGVASVTALRVAEQTKINQMNSNRRPPPRLPPERFAPMETQMPQASPTP